MDDPSTTSGEDTGVCPSSADRVKRSAYLLPALVLPARQPQKAPGVRKPSKARTSIGRPMQALVLEAQEIASSRSAASMM